MKTKLKYTIEEICSYVWSEILLPSRKVDIVPLSSRRLRFIYSKYDEIVSHLTKNKYLIQYFQGGFRKGVTTYRVLKEYPICDYSSFKTYVDKKRTRNYSRYINVDSILFGTDSISKYDSDKISKFQQDGLKEKFVENDKRFYHELTNLSKHARKQIVVNNNGKIESLVSIDINGTIPRLIPVFILNKIEHYSNQNETMTELKLWRDSIQNNDAYLGLMNVCDIKYSRSDFKKRLLPLIFGAGKKDVIDETISNKIFSVFPNLFTILKSESIKYRVAQSKEILTFKELLFAREIFKLEARIINTALKKITGTKFSVYDEIYVPESNYEIAIKWLEYSWSKICGDSDMFSISINGNLRSAQIDSLTPAVVPESKTNSKYSSQEESKNTHRLKEGEGEGEERKAIVSTFFEICALLTPDTQSNIETNHISQPKQE